MELYNAVESFQAFEEDGSELKFILGAQFTFVVVLFHRVPLKEIEQSKIPRVTDALKVDKHWLQLWTVIRITGLLVSRYLTLHRGVGCVYFVSEAHDFIILVDTNQKVDVLSNEFLKCMSFNFHERNVLTSRSFRPSGFSALRIGSLKLLFGPATFLKGGVPPFVNSLNKAPSFCVSSKASNYHGVRGFDKISQTYQLTSSREPTGGVVSTFARLGGGGANPLSRFTYDDLAGWIGLRISTP